METLSVTELRARLLRTVDRLQRDPDAIVQVTRKGRRVAALVSADRLDALVETIEILSDARTMQLLRRARKELEAGKSVPWDKARKQLGL
jgi:prevent-host-death family protein